MRSSSAVPNKPSREIAAIRPPSTSSNWGKGRRGIRSPLRISVSSAIINRHGANTYFCRPSKAKLINIRHIAYVMEGPTISDMSITDEHFVVDGKAAISSVAANLAKSPNDAILIKDKSGVVSGVVTTKDIFGAMSEGVNIMKVKFEKIMRTNLLTAPSNLPLTEAIDMIAKQGPDAIIIMDGPQFVGYFSPDDYRDATRRIEAHQTMMSRLSKSKNALDAAASSAPAEDEDETSDLLGVLLGGIEDQEDDGFGDISL